MANSGCGKDPDIIQEGDTVVFDVNNKSKVQFIQVKSGSTVRFGQGNCQTTDLVGHRFGTLFGLGEDGASLRPVAHEPSEEWDEQLEDVDRDGSNHIHDQEAGNQYMSREEIEGMKASGAEGATIVDALVTNSKNFDKMSGFAQKKYKKKKVDKYVLIGCARKPSAAVLAEAYYSRYSNTIGYLRPDTLALALTMANVGPYQNVLVLEASSGLVTGAVAEKLGGFGEKTIHTKPLFDLLLEVDGMAHRAKYFTDKKRDEDEDTAVAAPPAKPRFTSCIITAAHYSLKSSLFAVLPLLAPSATFVVVSQVLQPLVDCMNLLRVKNYAVGTTIHEAWTRDIQVLPLRTHPFMNMNHGGGYILTGTVTKRGRWVDLNQYTSSHNEDAV
eukprot:jgi/Picre1/32151/NNA_007497.t1